MKLLLDTAHPADIDTAVCVMGNLPIRTLTDAGYERNADWDVYHKSLAERGEG